MTGDFCAKCGGRITEEPHTYHEPGCPAITGDPDTCWWRGRCGEDCHADCCPSCHIGGFVIEAVHVFVAVDPADGDEGVPAFFDGQAWMPLIAANPQRLHDLRPIAERIAREQSIEIKLVRFDRRTNIETIYPTQEGT